jgi:UDP-N-acetylglucosamine 1-carboxyvinyltransferase
MSSFEIVGGNRLHGEIVPQGAKNEALQVLCATLLTSDKVVIENIPNIRDVNKLIDLLQLLGVKIKKLSDDTYQFQADNVDISQMSTSEFSSQATTLRGSIMTVGPMLARFGSAVIPQPGGD